MQKEIETEGVKEEKAYDKFMCYCTGNTDSMKKSAADGSQRADELSSKLEALKAEKAQLEQELVEHKASRESAKQDADKASSIRDAETAESKEEVADMQKNVASMKGAVAALSNGVAALVQMSADSKTRVERLVRASTTVDEFESQGIVDLLQGKETAMGTGQIIGMLEAMQEEMEGDLKSAIEAEASAAASFEDLTAAKHAEIESATNAIEGKTKRSGEVAVEIVQTVNDLEDTTSDVSETQTFLADLGRQCKEKKSAWDERVTSRANEVAAIGETIKILNDDSALDLFKKTASSPEEGLGFLQKSSKSSTVLRANMLVMSLAQVSRSHQTQLSLIAHALKAKAVDFGKITGMIDGMVGVLQKEQTDDNTQKDFCNKEFTTSAQDKKDTEADVTRITASIEEMSSSAAALASEVETLQAEIKTLDTAVAEATEQRKSDHDGFLSAQAENQAAGQILGKARDRMAAFYRPEEAAAPAFVQVRRSSELVGSAPPPPPETFGAYQKKSGSSNSVLGLLDEMMNDLKHDHTEAKHAEEMAQKDYEELMSASQKTRSSNAKSITEKESAKAEWQEKIENAKTDLSSTQDALATTVKYIAGLHASCDFLVENYDVRKEARTNEVEGLKNAKAVLSGANFS